MTPFGTYCLVFNSCLERNEHKILEPGDASLNPSPAFTGCVTLGKSSENMGMIIRTLHMPVHYRNKIR